VSRGQIFLRTLHHLCCIGAGANGGAGAAASAGTGP
jgi:hypothetical protein